MADIEIEGDIRFPANVIAGPGIVVERVGLDYQISNVEGPIPGPAGPAGATGATGATGTLPNGAVVQVSTGVYAAMADITSVIPADGTVPQIGEGTQIITASHTPLSLTNRLLVRFMGVGSLSSVNSWIAALFVNGATNAVRATVGSPPAAGAFDHIVFEYEYTPASLTAQTVAVRVGPASAGTLRLNGNTTGGAVLGASGMAATLTITEIKA